MPFPADSALGALMATLPRAGQVQWIGLRPAREQMPAEAQRGVMLTGQLGETAVAFHGGSLRQLLEEEYQTPLLKSQLI